MDGNYCREKFPKVTTIVYNKYNARPSMKENDDVYLYLYKFQKKNRGTKRMTERELGVINSALA